MSDSGDKVPIDTSKIKDDIPDGVCIKHTDPIPKMRMYKGSKFELICPDCSTQGKPKSTKVIMGNVVEKDGKAIVSAKVVDTGIVPGTENSSIKKGITPNKEQTSQLSEVSLLLLLAKDPNLKEIVGSMSDEFLINLKSVVESWPPPSDMKSMRSVVKLLDIVEETLEQNGTTIEE